MRKFNWQTMLIFVVSLFLAAILLGLGTAHISKLKQQRRQLSDNGVFDCVAVDLRPRWASCARRLHSAGFSGTFAEFPSYSCIPAALLRVSSDADDAGGNLFIRCIPIVAAS